GSRAAGVVPTSPRGLAPLAVDSSHLEDGVKLDVIRGNPGLRRAVLHVEESNARNGRRPLQVRKVARWAWDGAARLGQGGPGASHLRLLWGTRRAVTARVGELNDHRLGRRTRDRDHEMNVL